MRTSFGKAKRWPLIRVLFSKGWFVIRTLFGQGGL